MSNEWIFDDTAICTNHQGRTTKKGGKWLVSNNGKSRRWICAVCLANRNKRLEEMKKEAA